MAQDKSAVIERQTFNLWPDAGKILGLGRSATYEGAKSGAIPTVRIGRKILVPKVALEQMLMGGGKTAA